MNNNNRNRKLWLIWKILIFHGTERMKERKKKQKIDKKKMKKKINLIEGMNKEIRERKKCWKKNCRNRMISPAIVICKETQVHLNGRASHCCVSIKRCALVLNKFIISRILLKSSWFAMCFACAASTAFNACKKARKHSTTQQHAVQLPQQQLTQPIDGTVELQDANRIRDNWYWHCVSLTIWL